MNENELRAALEKALRDSEIARLETVIRAMRAIVDELTGRLIDIDPGHF